MALQYGNRAFPMFTKGDFGWGRIGESTPPTEQRTNPGDTSSEKSPGQEPVVLAGVSFPWGTAVMFMILGIFAVGWYLTARLR